jgi:hypothetical protein
VPNGKIEKITVPETKVKLSVALLDEFLDATFPDNGQLRSACRSMIEADGLENCDWLAISRRLIRGESEYTAFETLDIGVASSPAELAKELEGDELPKVKLVYESDLAVPAKMFRVPSERESTDSARSEFKLDEFLSEVRRVFTYDNDLLAECRKLGMRARPGCDWYQLVNSACEQLGREPLFKQQ